MDARRIRHGANHATPRLFFLPHLDAVLVEHALGHDRADVEQRVAHAKNFDCGAIERGHSSVCLSDIGLV